jgi:hypothetical protein
VRSRLALLGSMPERLVKLERAAAMEQLGRRQAEIDKAQAESVAALYEVMKEQKNAVIRVGSILMIKTEGDLVVWTISEAEAAALEQNAELLHNPKAVLTFLRQRRDAQEGHGGDEAQESAVRKSSGVDTDNE